MEKVLIREVGLRDGLQLVKKILPTEKKIEWLNMQAFLNFKEIEVTSFVPEKIVPQFFDSEEILQAAKSISGLTSSVLVPNFFGAKKAFELQAEKINCVISASESHNKANINKDIKSSITELSEIVSYNKSLENRSKIGVAISTSFGCSIEGEVSNQKVLHLVEKIIEIGVDEITIADTVGYANPKQVKMLFNSLIRSVGNLDIFAHFHDTRGLGMANVLTAFDLGIRKFDSSLLGLGGCPFAPGASGNVATEDIIYLFNSMKISTGIDLKDLIILCKNIRKFFKSDVLSGKILSAGIPKNFN